MRTSYPALVKITQCICLGLLMNCSTQAAPLNLQTVPLFLSSRADPNVLINMSVETPMGGAAYNDQAGTPENCTGRRNNVLGNSSADDIGSCYFADTDYLGYFDPYKCYIYDTSNQRFNPTGATSSTHTCSSAWSGNFLNWASMTAIDMFIKSMTGGNRTTDTTTLTVIRRARKQDNNSWFPRKVLNASINVAPSSVTPYNNDTLFIHNTAWGMNIGTTFASATSSTPNVISIPTIAVKVCDPSVGLETNCVAYDATAVYYKPEGLIQANATTKRFAIVSYTFDNNQSRDGGVLRSNMKYVGPLLPDGSANPAKEYGTNGLLINNPDNADSPLNSGVINYINQFSTPGYKSHDPIGELYYEGLRYFKHLGPTPEYSNNLTEAQKGGFQILTEWDDPIQYRCQKNFVVAINDANPWLDKKLPGTAFTNSTLVGASGTITLTANDYGPPSNPDPDINVTELTNKVGDLEGLNDALWKNTGTWTSGTASGANDSVGGGAGTFDNSCTAKTVAKLGEVMGTCPYPGKQNSYYIAGLAYYANTQDLRPDFANDRGIQNVQSFFIDTQEFNTSPLDGPKNMLWLAGKYGGFADKNDDAVPQTEEWDSDGNGVPDNYVLATDPQKLLNGLNKAFDFIDNRSASVSSASINTGSISTTTRIYQTKFNSGSWIGQLLSFPVNTDGTLGNAEWDAGALIPTADMRTIITVNSNSNGVPFRWANLDGLRQAQLQQTDSVTVAQDRLNYLRGDNAKEMQNGGIFRQRLRTLGDIIASAPVFVGKPAFRYPATLESESYPEFVLAKKNRTKMIYVGANDGMLHGFNATTGVEQLGFIPAAAFSTLAELTKSNYSHRTFVDGTPVVGDAFYGNAWHTLLVGGLNFGGQSIYALDVTNPNNFNEANANNIFRWEYTDSDLGYTYSRPAIVRMHNGKWAAAFGNGYNNTAADANPSVTGHAYLYFVDLETGVLLKKIDTGVGSVTTPNGLSTPALVDFDGDAIIDYAYAGDLQGNLWKFDLRATSAANWDVAYKESGLPKPLFTARDSNAIRQPITSRPEVGRGPNGVGMVILFGTGKYLEPSDKNIATLHTQSLYGLLDPNTTVSEDPNSALDSSAHISGRSLLTEQRIVYEISYSFTSPNGTSIVIPIRVTTANGLADHRGWFMDLLSPPNPPGLFQGEMQVADVIIRDGHAIFTTLIPTDDRCDFGGNSWLMEVDAVTGSRLEETPFDLNNDGKFDQNDFVELNGEKVPVGGVQSDVGITPAPGVLAGSTADYKYAPGSNGNMQIIVENPGANARGRQSWRQVQ